MVIGMGTKEREFEGVRDPMDSVAREMRGLTSWRVGYSSSRAKSFSISGSVGEDVADMRMALYTLNSRLPLSPSSFVGRMTEERDSDVRLGVPGLSRTTVYCLERSGRLRGWGV